MTITTSSSQTNASAVLVVEDEVLIRMNIAQYLRECGYRVIEAADTDEALEVLQSGHAINLVLSDVQMPGTMDGFGLAQWVRKHRQGVKIILAGTPERAADSAAELCEEGPTLSKPYEPQALLDVIRRQLGLYEMEKSLSPAL